MIATAAAAALALGHRPASADPVGHAVLVHRLRVRVCRDVAVMLDVPAAYVVATDDPDRAYGSHPGHLLTVHDPDDPTTVYRFVPEPGLGGIYLLLDECPACAAPRVPMATVSGMADLVAHLAATRPAPPDVDDPDDHGDRPEPPEEFFGDRPPPGLRVPPSARVTTPAGAPTWPGRVAVRPCALGRGGTSRTAASTTWARSVTGAAASWWSCPCCYRR